MLYGFGTDGRGQTISCTLCGQNSLIFSYRYHCLSADSPGGTSWLGRSSLCGCQDEEGFSKFIICSGSSILLLTITFPGCDFENRKWCIFVISLRAVLTVCSSKKPLQSYIGTIEDPS